MKFDALHWIQLALMLVASGAGAISQAMPQWAHVCVPIVAGAGGMLSALGLVSGSIVLPKPPLVASESHVTTDVVTKPSVPSVTT